jgi:hypothetical protein
MEQKQFVSSYYVCSLGSSLFQNHPILYEEWVVEKRCSLGPHFFKLPNFVSPMGHIKKMRGEEDERRLGV